MRNGYFTFMFGAAKFIVLGRFKFIKKAAFWAAFYRWIIFF
jgi:hypothetical protein